MAKVIATVFLFIITITAYGKSFLISPLPLPKTIVLNIETKECDEETMWEYLDKGEIFSFLSLATTCPMDEELKQEYRLYSAMFQISRPLSSEGLAIAILSPINKIGKYSSTTTKSVISYLLYKKIPFNIKMFPLEDEERETLKKSIELIEEEGFRYVIAPLTGKGAKTLFEIETDLKIYLPTINSSIVADIERENSPIFGGIDYERQIEELLGFTSEKIAIFYDGRSSLAERLTEMIETKANPKKVKIYRLTKESYNLKRYFYQNSDLNASDIFLNTPIVKSALILSQLTLFDLEPPNILSTQINYNPLLFTLTQPKDRKNLIIANSINSSHHLLSEFNSLLNNDMEFNWINYSTSIGADLFYHDLTAEAREFDEELKESQIIYTITLQRALKGGFVPVMFLNEIDRETPGEL